MPLSRPARAPAAPRTGVRLGGTADAGDLAVFLGRALPLDPAALTRLRAAGGRVTAFVRLPFGVLVSRTVAGTAEPRDVTVAAADLLSGLDTGSPTGMALPWPARRDMQWRAALPPADGWRRMDAVPGEVVRTLVRAGRDALRTVPAGAAAAAGESLLDHESLVVTGAGRTAALPLRVLSALTRMGFLGGDPVDDVVVVSAAGGWVRLAAAYGSAYQHLSPGLGLSPR